MMSVVFEESLSLSNDFRRHDTPSTLICSVTGELCPCEALTNCLIGDPGCKCIDAFTVSWSSLLSYIFAPFSLLGRVVQKLRRDRAESTVNKGNNTITELRTILQRESQNNVHFLIYVEYCVLVPCRQDASMMSVVFEESLSLSNDRPPVSRYVKTWDVNIVLNKLRNLSPVKYISLKVLSMKLAMILCLVLAERTQSLYLLTIENMLKGTQSYVEHSFLKIISFNFFIIKFGKGFNA
jgi:hypothetical protein